MKSTLEALASKIDELEKALETSQTTQQGSFRAHRLSAAALTLAEKLETNQGAASELKGECAPWLSSEILVRLLAPTRSLAHSLALSLQAL